MDLQTRKLNLISYLAQLQDENFIAKIKNFILNRHSNSSDIKPFTEEELMARIKKSEEDFKNGKFKTQHDIEEISANW